MSKNDEVDRVGTTGISDVAARCSRGDRQREKVAPEPRVSLPVFEDRGKYVDRFFSVMDPSLVGEANLKPRVTLF